MTKLETYKELKRIIEESKEPLASFIADSTLSRLQELIIRCDLEVTYGYKFKALDRIRSLDLSHLNDNMSIRTMDGITHKISWEVNGRQPQNETLFVLSFNLGAYFFGDDYPVDLFNSFFKELRKYKPSYIDYVNHKLYFTLENGAKVYNNFDSIVKKYRDQYREEANIRKIIAMEKELKELKGE